jgi:hypothetical protein
MPRLLSVGNSKLKLIYSENKGGSNKLALANDPVLRGH